MYVFVFHFHLFMNRSFFRHVLPEAQVFVICSVEFITIEIYSSMVTKQNGYHMFEVSEHSRTLQWKFELVSAKSIIK